MANNSINLPIKTVKEAIQNALQALVNERFRELSEFEMKEILHDRMFESGSYRSQSEHAALYDALEVSMDRENREEFIDATAKSRKRRRDNQDPPPPPSKDSDQNKKKRHDSDASASKQSQAQTSSAWKTSNTREAPSSSSKPDWLKPVPEEERPETPEPDWAIPPNDLPETENNWANAIANAYKDPEENKLIQKTRDMGSFIKWYCKQIGKSKLSKADLEGLAFNEHVYDISASYGISHYWFKRKEFYITRNSALSDRRAVRSHMEILSVVSLKTFSRYSYTFLREIVLRRADYKEYKISKADFKNLHPNDFEELYLLHLQGNLNHLSGADKVHLFNAVNLWIRNIVIRQQDYTIVYKPRAIIYRDRNNQKKMMRESEVHKFNDGKLTRIMEKLDHMVKDYVLFKFNPGLEHRIWSEDDKRRSKEFIEVIERRLKIRRIFRSLESFVSGRLRDVDYRLIQRTK
ncbi:hypothetical protein Tco_0829243 [Tanacetum coccineum]